MGAGTSALSLNGGALNDIVEKLMPMYYQKEPVTQEDIYIAENSWRVILDGNSPMMTEMREATGLMDADGMDLYRELFFTRLFDIHDEAKPLFTEKAVRSGKFLGSVMQLCFTQLQNPKAFRKKIAALAESHCQMGIRTIEYGIIGDVMFWSLQKILRDMYTRTVEKAWLKLFSSMLKIIVPIAVTFERDEGRFKRAAVQRAANSTMFFSQRGRNSIHAGTSKSVVSLYSRHGGVDKIAEEEETETLPKNIVNNSKKQKGAESILPIIDADNSVSVMIKPGNY